MSENVSSVISEGSRPYPEYKDSGVEWLGEIPSHWGTVRLGQIGTLSKGNGGNKQDEVEQGVPCIRYGDLYTTHDHFITESRSFISRERSKDYTPIEYGDVLFAASGETADEIGKSAVNLIRSEACCGGDIILFRAKGETDAQYMGYATDCSPSNAQKTTMGRGFTIVHIYGNQLKYLTITLPPLSEQQAIGRFLDHKTSEIDALIAAKERLITLLQEKRAALITYAVTKGLDPSVPMKDSGIEWIGEIPMHWIEIKLSYVTKVFNGTTPSRNHEEYWTDGNLPWLSSGKVNDEIVMIPTEYISENAVKDNPLYLVPKGSVIMGMVGQGKTRGMSTLMGIDAYINQNLAGIVPNEKLDSRFLNYFFSMSYRPIREAGRGGNQEALNCAIISAFKIPLPPISEQKAIADALDRRIADIKDIISKTKKLIALLYEYRVALISAAVVGKIDIRDWQEVLIEPEEGAF